MTNRLETYDHYLSVCKLHKKEVNQLIKTALEQPNKLEPRQKFNNQDLSSYLNLSGNNYFLKNKKLTSDDAFCLFHSLKLNSWVFSLDLRYNCLNDEGASWIAKLITESGTINYLNLMCNDIGPEGAEQLALALQNNSSLTYLNLNGNKIGNKGGMCMAQMLQINTTLLHLDIGDTDQKIESLIALSTILNYNRSLKSLNINRPVPQYQFASWMDEIAIHYAKMLKVNKTLCELHMQKYELRDYGAQWLSENLVHNFQLAHLDLSCNRITRDGAVFIANYLKSDTPLRTLDLGHNRIENEGAISIAEALMFANTNLERLSLKYNNIGTKGLVELAYSFKQNKSLKEIFIWGNHLEEPASNAFQQLIGVRILQANTDVRPYVVDGKVHLCEMTNGINMFYYWQPSHGDGVIEAMKNEIKI